MQIMARQTQRGVLLIEVLLSLALFLAISTIIAQALSAGFVSEKTSRMRTVASSAIEEMLTRVRAASEESWGSIAQLQRNTPYAMTLTANHYVPSIGTSTVVIDGTSYALSFTVQDASRTIAATTTPLALTATSSSVIDSGSLLITANAMWGTGESLVVSTVLTRWRNIVCGQTGWSLVGSSTVGCETPNILLGTHKNIQVGDKLQLCTGC